MCFLLLYCDAFLLAGDQTYLVSAVMFILALPLLGMLIFYCRIVRVSARSTRAISKHGGVLVVKLRRRDRKLNQVRAALPFLLSFCLSYFTRVCPAASAVLAWIC